jgi:hypothetical protein
MSFDRNQLKQSLAELAAKGFSSAPPPGNTLAGAE